MSGKAIDSFRQRSRHLFSEEGPYFRLMVENALDLIRIHSLDGTILYASPACKALFGYEVAEMEGTSGFTYLHPDFISVMRKVHREILETEKQTVVQFKFKMKTGEYKWVESTVRAIKDPARDNQGMLMSITRDIESRKRVEHRLIKDRESAEKATHLEDEFLSMVSHSLRSSIASQIMFLNYFKEHRNDGQVDSLITKALKNCGNLVSMIDNLLTEPRIKDGRISIMLETVTTSRFAETAFLSLQVTADAKNVALQNDVSPDHTIKTDYDLFQQVVTELVSNAIKFCGRGDIVSIHLGGDEFRDVIEIRDTGLGIRPEILANIFNPAVITTTRGTQGELGHGMGIPFCNQIVTALAGQITINSEAGKGTSCFLSIPR